MSDADLISTWKTITDPLEALEAIVENQEFFGYDRYYGELHEALLAMAERVAAEQRARKRQKEGEENGN